MKMVALQTHRKSLVLMVGLVWACASVCAPVPAMAAGKQAAMTIDANTGHVITASNADEPRYPASLTKMMTLYVVFDLMEQGRLQPSTRITMSAFAASAPPSKLGLRLGDDIALIDAIKVLITRSANDVAVAIAEHIAGSEDRFAALMTQKARAIGMKSSTFKNASGLPNEAQVTTARDMITLGLRLQDDFPKYYGLFAIREFRHEGRAHANHNTMLGTYEGTEGIKTGYTHASGYNLVASVKRGDKHVMGAVFGGHSAASRNQTMKTLLNIALLKSSPVKTRQKTSLVAQARPTPEPRPVARPGVATTGAPAVDWKTKVAAAKPVDGAPRAPGVVETVRVRPVLVAPRAPKQAPTVAGIDPTQTPSVMMEPEGQRAVAAAPVDVRLPPIAGTLDAAPVPTKPAQRQQVAAGIAPSPGVAAAASQSQRGAPPGTLQQQAAHLSGRDAGAQAPPTYQLNGPRGGAGDTEIQIGAFQSSAEAERQIGVTRSKAGDVLGDAVGVAQAAVASGRQVWRARFTGFQSASAAQVCGELRRRQIDCLVVRPE